jgi:hypothetical protein
MELCEARVSLVVLGRLMVRAPPKTHGPRIQRPSERVTFRLSRTKKAVHPTKLMTDTPTTRTAPRAEITQTFHRAEVKHVASQF